MATTTIPNFTITGITRIKIKYPTDPCRPGGISRKAWPGWSFKADRAALGSDDLSIGISPHKPSNY
jgi:hypothetical protein